MKKTRQLGTQVIHAGLALPEQGAPFNNGPVFASTFHLSGDTENAHFQYGRFSNPTWEALETALSELEGGQSIIFPSGMAAIAAILSSLTQSGDKIVLTGDGYFATRAYAIEFLAPNNIHVNFVNTLALPEYDYSDVKLVLVETPSNPLLDVIDIQALATKVHRCGGLLAIDNTTSTVLGQQPLKLGADISMSADTKAVNGHSDVLFGHVSCVNSEVTERIRLWRKLAGNIPGPMETWLVHRGLATLDVRLERMNNNALAIAKMLSKHSKVNWVRYPGLEQDPSYQTASRQMHYYGFIISFDLSTQANAQKFLEAELVYEATSFGGTHTMAERRARWGTDDVPEGMIRLSVGCERTDDLLNALKNALDAI